MKLILYRFSFVIVLLCAALHTATAAPRAGLEPLPEPALDTLEATVASQFQQARALLDEALGQDDTSTATLAELYGSLGRLYHAYERLEAAAPCYRNAARLAPTAFAWPYYSAVLSEQTGQIDAALRGLLETLLLNPNYLPARLRLAAMYRALDRPEMALALYRMVLEQQPDEAAALAGFGELLLEQGQAAAAVDYLQAALTQTPTANRLHYPLALAYRALGEDERARAHLAERGTIGIAAADPLLTEMRLLAQGERIGLLQGQLAYRVGQYQAAASAFEQALASAPDSIAAHVGLGSALAGLQQYPQAMAEFRKVLTLDPKNTAARYNLGVLLLRNGEPEQAIIHLQALVDLKPQDGTAHLELADALRLQGRHEAALQHYEAAIKNQSSLSRAWLNGGRLLYELERYGEALQVLEQAHRTLPADPAISHALARLLAISPDPELRDAGRAVELAQTLVQAQPLANYVETLAKALAANGDCTAAANWQSRLLAAAEAKQTADNISYYQQDLAYYQSADCGQTKE